MTNNSFKSFASPANSLRAAPFWAWNSIITKKGVKEEIAAMKEMGLEAPASEEMRRALEQWEKICEGRT